MRLVLVRAGVPSNGAEANELDVRSLPPFPLIQFARVTVILRKARILLLSCSVSPKKAGGLFPRGPATYPCSQLCPFNFLLTSSVRFEALSALFSSSPWERSGLGIIR